MFDELLSDNLFPLEKRKEPIKTITSNRKNSVIIIKVRPSVPPVFSQSAM